MTYIIITTKCILTGAAFRPRKDYTSVDTNQLQMT